MQMKLVWSKDHWNWIAAEWNSIIWSDESKFEVCTGDSRKQVIWLPKKAWSCKILWSASGDFIFQQDGASCHTAKVNKKWFEEHNISYLSWPSTNPDVSPIDTLAWNEESVAHSAC